MSIKREWLVLVAVSVIYLFAAALTFQSMGIVLYAMQGEFHWSEAAAGGVFLAFGVVCAATSLLPVPLIPRFGVHAVMVTGGMVITGGCLLAATTASLSTMIAAASLFGLAFSLVANTCGIFLIASWFGDRAPAMIGLYLTAGTLGGVIGPPVADALVASDGGWRLHWRVMALVALLVTLLCLAFIRNPPHVAGNGGDSWKIGRTVLKPQFIIIAAAMVATQACMLTVSGEVPPHFVRLGWSSGYAAEILSLQSLVGTGATALSSWLIGRYDCKQMLVAALLAEAAGMLLIALARDSWMIDAFVLLYGAGWSVVSLAVTVLLVRYFGNMAGSAALSAVWMLAGFAAIGPSLAGWVADTTGSFAPALAGFGLLLLPIAGAALLMAQPRPDLATLSPAYQRD